MTPSHVSATPAILYFGTPVALISTLNPDGSANLAPMSSVFFLGWRAILGLDGSSQTAQNLIRTRQCVVNLPSVDGAAAVDRLARTTGADPVPPRKVARGYRHVGDKFAAAGLTPVSSATVAPPRAFECPVQLESAVAAVHEVAADQPAMKGRVLSFELRIQRVLVDPALLMEDRPDHVDPDKWRPLIMSFQKFYGLAPGQVQYSHLAEIPESLYRTPDFEQVNAAP